MDDEVTDYLKALKTVTRPTRDEEYTLGVTIQEGREAARMLDAGGLRGGAVTAARRRVEAGKQARTRLVESALSTVPEFALRMEERNGLTVMDLIQEGNLALFKAADRYDPQTGFRFESYAERAVIGAMTEALSATQDVRVSKYMLSEVQKLARARRELGTGDRERLADHLGVTVDRVKYLESVEAVRFSTSLNAPVDDPEGVEFGDVIPADATVDEMVLAGLTVDSLTGALSGLTGPEIAALDAFKHGEQVASERVLSRALAKLRHPSRSQNLHGLAA